MAANGRKLPEATDWSAPDEQQFWFDQYKSSLSTTVGQVDFAEGIRFNQFQDFLKVTLYTYFEHLANSDRNRSSSYTKDNEDINPPSKLDVNSKFSYQQELQLFRAFDTNNDHIIDRDEFSHLCQNWLDTTYRRAWALVVVDVQNDFIDGSLALINGPARQDGAEVVPVINSLIDSGIFEAVAYTQDWHPRDHIGFYDNLHLRKYTLKTRDLNQNSDNVEGGKGASGSDSNKCLFKLKKLSHKVKLFDSVLFDEGRIEQKLWPIHCIQNSWGAELHPKLKVTPNAIRVYKGTLSHLDAYSAFWDNMHQNETGLRQELSSRKISDVFFCGVALDYCVASSALDSVKAGFLTLLIEDACRGLDNEEIARRKNELVENGVLIITSDSLLDDIEQQQQQQTANGVNHSSSGKTIRRAVDMKTMLLAKWICLKRAFGANLYK